MFNLEEFDIKLDTEEIGRNFLYVDELESTNSYLMNSDEDLNNGTIVLAEFQSNGKGRRDRDWHSQKNQNLTFSVLLNENLENVNINIINFAACLSVAQTLECLYQLNIDLKWPNDVLVSGRKLSGILLEMTTQSESVVKIVIGFGLNVNQPNFKGHYILPPTSIRREFKSEVSREKLLSELLNTFEENLILAFNSPNKILSDWRSKCKMIGEKIKIESESESETEYGIFEDIDDNGFLVLKTHDGIKKIITGDVSLRQNNL